MGIDKGREWETIKDGWELAKLREGGEQNHESDCTINTNVAYQRHRVD